MESHPLISIVLPTYNRSGFLGETIKSIQEQTWRYWELLIIDDGSSDDTADIVSSLDDKRISYFKEAHQGMEAARNNGMTKTSGELIGFMDSDDLWEPTKLEKQIALFKEQPEVEFCLTGGYEFKVPGEPLVFFYKQRTGTRTGDLFVPFFQSQVVALPQTLLFKRKCLAVVSFPRNIELAHIHFILTLALHFKGAILFEPLLQRRIHHSNYSSIHEIKRHYDGLALIRHYEKDLPRQIFINALLRSHVYFGEKYLTASQRVKAIGEFFQAWRCRPLSIVPVKKIAKALLKKTGTVDHESLPR